MNYSTAFSLCSAPANVDDETLLDATVRVLAEVRTSKISTTTDRALRAARRVKETNARIYWQAREIAEAQR